MSIAQIFKSSFYYGVIPKISTLINVLLLPIITPYLTPYDYGIWGIISSYSGMFLAIALWDYICIYLIRILNIRNGN